MLKNRCTFLRNNQGFSLVELMVAVVIFVLVLTMVYQFFTFSGNLEEKSNTLASKQNEARLIIQGLRKDFGTALAIGIVDTGTGEPDDYTVDAGYGLYAVYVNNEFRLTRRDSDGPPEYFHSLEAVDYLAVQFSSTTPGILHVAITVEGVPVADTDIYTRNTAINTDPADGFSASGNLILYQPSE